VRSRSRQILSKATAALLAAIEVYNKPNFEYREEAFAILVVNAWELLLKARILQLSRNRVSSILEYEHRRTATGQFSEKRYRKKNRAGNHVSVGLFRAFDLLRNEYRDVIPHVVRSNLEALTEVRDNAVHFLNSDLTLRKKVHELGTASVKNFLHLTEDWFGTSLGDYQLYLLPIGFVQAPRQRAGVLLNAEERNWLEYVSQLEAAIDDDTTNDTNLSLDIDIRFSRRTESPHSVRVTDDPAAVEVRVSEEDLRDQYPWTYDILSRRLSRRYKDFLMNQDYHRIRQALEDDNRFCRTRYLDPGNPRSSTKKFYSPNIVREFDAHYQRRRT